MNLKIFQKPWFLLCLIILLAGFLRFYQLGVNPPSLTWDEVAWGYNAYSIGIDGKDEFGHFLPFTSFVSFGDYKPPVYAYLTVVPIWIFGLTEFTVRFPSALFGTLTVLVTYFLVRELFYTSNYRYRESLALLSTLILAVSPWHIMLSRAAFEANVASFFIVVGVWLFLYSVRVQKWLMIASVISFVLCIYTFNSVRVVAPLLFVVLVLGHIKPLLTIKKAAITAFIIGAIVLLPTVPFLLSHDARLRYQEVNIFSDIKIVQTSNQDIANNHNAIWAKLLYNRRVLYTSVFLQHYFDQLNPNFLFIKGDANPKFSTQDVGQMYLWDLPFLLVGVLFFFRRREGKWWIVPLWLVIGIIPAAISLPTPHALRSEATLPTWQILTAYGVVTMWFYLKRYQKYLLSFYFIILFLSVGYYLHGYYTHYPKEYSAEWQYGYKQAVQYIGAHQQNYKQVDISGIERGYIYTLFYLKYPPQQFRNSSKVYSDVFGFVHVDGFDKYKFISTPITKPKRDILYIADAGQLPAKVTVLQTFYNLDGTPTLVAYTK
ncbi:MAG TPA: glycosyltransferase family 39 protein [Candidatus Saccharimonadales bacterium]|nr:glycosyltransferase family 39 protein [Candidatus Saccharimonadales bacterium]